MLFLYREVLHQEIGTLDAIRAKRPKRLPTVLTKEEAKKVITCIPVTYRLIAQVLYGSGIRLMECVRLRVQDLDFAQRQIIVRDGKRQQDRITVLPEILISPLHQNLQHVKLLHEDDIADGFGCVYLPYALERKYPNASREWVWQYVFPARNRSADPHSGVIRRHHADPSSLQKAIKKAGRAA